MASMIVSYDLKQPGRDYNSLYDKLKSYPYYCRITESTWFIKPNKQCSVVRDEIMSLIDSNDRLFVGVLTGEAAWFNTIGNSEYLKEHL
jgi:hypothetical protein